MQELEFQEQVIKTLKNCYNKIYILNTCMRYSVGVPDLLIGLDGKFIGIELKVVKGDRATIKSLFPRTRKQIPTLFDIDRAGNKGYGLILFNQSQRVMLFRINFEKFPLNESSTLKHINSMVLSSHNNVYPEFIECIIDYRLDYILRCIK